MSSIKNPIKDGDGDARHGTIGGYSNHGCRCELCRAANVKATKAGRDRRSSLLADDDPRHGKASTYFNHKCRCRACKDARNRYERGLR